MLADLHLHSTASDGSDTPFELAEKLISSGIGIFSLTDHDTTDGLHDIINATNSRIKCITGIEFSCRESGRSCHILGYGFAPDSPEIAEVLKYSRSLRLKNAEKRIEYLKNEHGISFSEEEIEWFFSWNSPSKAHLAKLLKANGYATTTEEAFHRYLDGAKKYEQRLSAKDAITAIIKAGAIPVWAHPLGGEGEAHTSPEEVLPSLISYGLRGLECYYSRYTAEESAHLVSLAEKHTLLISGGSDYHGENKDVLLAQLSSDQTSVSSEKLSVLNVL